MPMLLPVSRSISMSIFAPLRPSGVSPATSLRTISTVSSRRPGSLWNVATRANTGSSSWSFGGSGTIRGEPGRPSGQLGDDVARGHPVTHVDRDAVVGQLDRDPLEVGDRLAAEVRLWEPQLRGIPAAGPPPAAALDDVAPQRDPADRALDDEAARRRR